MKSVGSKDFESEVLRSNVPVVVDFYTDGCPPCRLVGPLLEQIEQESTGQIKVVKVDAAAEPDFTASFRVTAVPTVFLFRGGQRLTQFTGAKSKKDIKKWIDDALPQK